MPSAVYEWCVPVPQASKISLYKMYCTKKALILQFANYCKIYKHYITANVIELLWLYMVFNHLYLGLKKKKKAYCSKYFKQHIIEI